MASYILAWDAASGSLAVNNHEVEYTPSGFGPTVVETGSASTTYTVDGLSDTPYQFRVRAKSGELSGPWSVPFATEGYDGAVPP